MNLPTGIVTFLFTDVEGSTKLWEACPESMRPALARHDALLRQAIEVHGGSVFKTIGDAFCAAFPTALEGLTAALAAQQALIAEPWSTDAPIRVRMALHAGTAEERDNDYFGRTVNRVARLLAIGHGGQVLLSQAVYELVNDHLPATLRLENLREHRLKDLARPETVYQLQHPDLPTLFAPLRSLGNPQFPNNLPHALTEFVGREQGIREVKERLDAHRLITLFGSGGCGKTRLALQAAAETLERYPDGVWFVELASLTDAALILPAIAQELAIREAPGKSLSQVVVEYLQTRHLLIVLDNCEHLLDACAQIAELVLRACPQVKILATSREALRVTGETTYRVPSLSLPPPQKRLPFETLLQYEAVQLFVERAEAIAPAYHVAPQNAPALASICSRLDGIPLAIELAAARMRTLSIEEIDLRLKDRFRLLTGGSRTALPRQQTLRALMDWSYDLLDPQERLLLNRLSVFAGRWTLAATERVAAGTGPMDVAIEDWEILDLLTSLADKSLVIAETQSGVARFYLLQTVRQYAREKLTAGGEESAVRRQHCSVYLALAEEAASKLEGQEQQAALETLEVEHDNLREALFWCRGRADQVETELRLVTLLARFWMMHGYWSEGRERMAALLESGASEQTPERAKVLYFFGALAHLQGDSAVAVVSFDRALEIQRVLGNRAGEATTLSGRGIVAWQQGDFAQARAVFERARTLHRELGNGPDEAAVLNNLGLVLWQTGELAAARARFEEALARFRALSNRGRENATLINLGVLTVEQGDYMAARTSFEQALVTARALGDRPDEATVLYNLGHLSRHEGNTPAARASGEQSLALSRELGRRSLEALCLQELGKTAGLEGHDMEARSLQVQALTTFQQLGQSRETIDSLEALATLKAVQEMAKSAGRLLGAAEALRENLGSPLPLNERAAYEATRARIRTTLGEADFVEIWAAGRLLSLEQAVAEALQESL